MLAKESALDYLICMMQHLLDDKRFTLSVTC